MSKHTPGPWAIADKYNGFVPVDAWDGLDCSSVEVCQVGDEAEGQQMANAHLIAAAPELLEALEWIVFHLDRRLGNRPNLITSSEKQRLTAAIAKAKGA